MYCNHCGTALPEGSLYCTQCGRPQPAVSAPAGAGQAAREGPGALRWETCEIVARWQNGMITDGYHFEAEAIGPHGPYIAGRSRAWKEIAHAPRWRVLDSSNRQAATIVKELISDLIKDAWESTGERGSNWENYRFRRAVTD
jgi:hypothetical protein